MFVKIAFGNIRRSLSDYSVYFFALALAACLLYSFTGSGDYLLSLDLTDDQRGFYETCSSITQAFSVFSVVVFAFLIVYANRFILRRRSREFGLYQLLGMEPGLVARILCYENVLVGLLSLAAGIGAGVLLSPLMGSVTAFVFNAPWAFRIALSQNAALWTAECFAAIMAAATLLSIRDLGKRTLISLMDAAGAPEKIQRIRLFPPVMQGIVAAVLLAVVWGMCILQPVQFIMLMIPLGFAAVFATGIVFRLQAQRRPRRARKHPDRYWQGLRCFTLRQIEERVSSGSNALACTCVLSAVGICMMVAGFAFSVGMRGPGSSAGLADTMAPVGFIGIFYGATFLVSAMAVLALQLMTAASDSQQRFRLLEQLGCERRLMERSLRSFVGYCFVTPTAFALVHCVFGLLLIGFLALVIGSQSYGLVCAGCIGFALALFGVYFLLTYAVSKRMLLRPLAEGEGAATS
uniref:ABC transporter permease n=1 Tax=Muribaculaceae bacterium Z82 TaxID=2304548 RepID=A0A7C9P5V0_9BACT